MQEADAKLHNFLCATLGGEAGLLVETLGREGQGFEVWRRLSAKYGPTDGQFGIDSLISLPIPKPANDFNMLPGAITRFAHVFGHYEKRRGEVLLEKYYNVASVVQRMFKQRMLKKQATGLRCCFANGLSNYTCMAD